MFAMKGRTFYTFLLFFGLCHGAPPLGDLFGASGGDKSQEAAQSEEPNRPSSGQVRQNFGGQFANIFAASGQAQPQPLPPIAAQGLDLSIFGQQGAPNINQIFSGFGLNSPNQAQGFDINNLLGGSGSGSGSGGGGSLGGLPGLDLSGINNGGGGGGGLGGILGGLGGGGGGSPAPGPVGPAPPSDLNALLNGLGFGGGAAGGGNLQDLINLVNGGSAPAPDIITDVTLNCRVRRQEVGSAQECSTQTNGGNQIGVCRWDAARSQCLCPVQSKEVCEAERQCHWLSTGKCIHNTERLYNVLHDKLVKRGKKDLAISIVYNSRPSPVQMPYGIHGPQIVNAFDMLQRLRGQGYNPYGQQSYGYGGYGGYSDPYRQGYGGYSDPYSQGYGGYSDPYSQGYGGYNDPYSQYGKSQYGYNQPQYGYNQPQYGYNQPQYGYNQPQYGYEEPHYGYEEPKYGYEEPKYGYEEPKYGYEEPKYGNEPPKYGYEPPRYGPEPPRYSYQPPRYGPEPPRYGPEPPRYGPEPPKYGPESPRYGPESPKYGPEEPKYGYESEPPKYDHTEKPVKYQ